MPALGEFNAMKTSIMVISTLLIGFVMGWYSFKIWSQVVEPRNLPTEISYEHLFELSSTVISDENFMCEGYTKNRVGAVLSSIFKANSNQYANKINEYCEQSECSISFSNCLPWQSDSCGSTFLSFRLSARSEIEQGSFKCLHLP